MARTLSKIPTVVFIVLISTTAATAGEGLGSIVSSFLLRDGLSQPPTTGMEYVDGDLWTLQTDRGATLVKRTHPAGSILSSYKVTNEDLLYACLTHDGQYFWVGCCGWLMYENPRLLKISASTMSIVSSVPLTWFDEAQVTALAWEGPHLWLSYYGSPDEIYRVSTVGSVVASFAVPYREAVGMAYAPGLTGGARLFEGYRSGADNMVQVWKAASHQSDYGFEVGKSLSGGFVECWDGEYLGVIEYGAGANYAYRIVAWPRDAAVEPASLGRVRAVFR